jgi:diadenylate cyclase
MERLEQFARLVRVTEVSFTDVLDVLIISFVIYHLFLLLKGTRAAKIAGGIAFLALVYFASRIAQLRTIQWFLTNFVTYAVFAVIVVYQAEIRKILANIGEARFLGRFFEPERAGVIDDIVLAAMTLSSKRTGALIVIERSTGLKGYMENGHELNARLSYDLLVTLFQPDTPLHDGAVIVQQDRIAAASCFLPLTLEPHLSKEYGTRHRAAIGITEETDAVAVVVSEETGRMSVAVAGRLKRFTDSESLTAFLKSQLTPTREKRRLGWPWSRKEAEP